jgi:hypothetical protein
MGETQYKPKYKAEYTPDKSVDLILFRDNLFKYLNRETRQLGLHNINTPLVITVAYNLKDGVGIRTDIFYSVINREVPSDIRVGLESDVNDVSELEDILDMISDKSKKIGSI